MVARNFHTGAEVRIRVVGGIAVVEVELVVPVRVRHVAVGEAPVFLSVFVRITENLLQDFLRFLCWCRQALFKNGQAVSLISANCHPPEADQLHSHSQYIKNAPFRQYDEAEQVDGGKKFRR